MNIVSTIAAAAIAIGAAATTAEAEHVQRALILGGQEVKLDSKQYTTGVRSDSADGYTFCNGALIAPNLVLTAGHCGNRYPDYVSVGTHYNTGTKDGEQIKINSVYTRIESENSEDTNYDFAVLVLERSSIYPHVNLPEINATLLPDTWTRVMGWGFTSYPVGEGSSVLLSVELPVRENKYCGLPSFADGALDLCAGGVPGKDVCYGDMGAPLVVEGNDGDSDDVLYGLSNGGGKCTGNSPSTFAAVSTAVEWIQGIALQHPAATNKPSLHVSP